MELCTCPLRCFGEAKGARERFRELSKADREALIEFVKSI